MANVIDIFRGEYRFLSNFYPAKVPFEGFIYPTVEHAYQAAKTFSQIEREVIRRCDTPGQAKRVAKDISLRLDWREIRIDVMKYLVREKFYLHKELREKLLATGDAMLIEGNTWGDTFWGQCDGQGKNHLGLILMNVRSELMKS
jgi:ribA/ribD-fused uncharacterized protein